MKKQIYEIFQSYIKLSMYRKKARKAKLPQKFLKNYISFPKILHFCKLMVTYKVVKSHAQAAKVFSKVIVILAHSNLCLLYCYWNKEKQTLCNNYTLPLLLPSLSKHFKMFKSHDILVSDI